MNYVIQKGVAGLGNRLQVAGWSLDLAVKLGVPLWIDWRTPGWRRPFYDIFQLTEHPEPDIIGFQRSYPECWPPTIGEKHTDCERHPAYEIALKSNRCPPNLPADLQGYDAVVTCAYTAPYSPRLFQELRPVETLWMRAMATLFQLHTKPGAYNCWHIRNTDKQGPDPDELLKRIPAGDLLVTDNRDVKERAETKGILCPSVLPPVVYRDESDPRIQKRGRMKGPHYTPQEVLDASGISRDTLNAATIVDLLVAGLSKDFYLTCPQSTFATFIRRGREEGWFQTLREEHAC